MYPLSGPFIYLLCKSYYLSTDVKFLLPYRFAKTEWNLLETHFTWKPTIQIFMIAFYIHVKLQVNQFDMTNDLNYIYNYNVQTINH